MCGNITFPVVVSRGPHPFPSRTGKLSLLEPMVLRGQLCGRVGSRRDYLEKPAQGKLERAFSINHSKPSTDRMKKAGRNDPCPCGSGRKYKNCCLASLTASDFQYRHSRQTHASLIQKLMTFFFENFSPELANEAWKDFNDD